MLDSTHPFASGFLLVVAVFFAVLIALPLLFAPLRWARWFAWEVPVGRADLTVYLGRCTGGVATAVLITLLRSAPDPMGNLTAFELIAQIGVIMTCVHVHGALKRAQPWTETAEIALYVGVTAVALWLRLSLARSS